MSLRRTISDLPQFTVTAIKQLDAAGEPTVRVELSGTFDRLRGVKEWSGWLLLPERRSLPGLLEHLDLGARTGVFSTSGQPAVDVTGMVLPYVDGRWEAYHVWMVAEPGWVWTRTLFQASDAVAERVRAQDGKEWIKLSKAPIGNETGAPLHVYPGPHDVGSEGIVKGGWDHEHCELCQAHVDPGDFGYLDLADHWICEGCYTQFVSTHDLSFLGNYWPEAF